MTVTARAVKDEALRLGFAACGISSLDPIPHAESLDHWLEAGYGGTMRYIHRQAKTRKRPAFLAPAAKCIVVVIHTYYSRGTPSHGPRLARYAQGMDYHTVTLDRLEQLGDFLKASGANLARAYVDTGPLQERELAQRAGLGWIGKNTMLLRPGLGSWFFIGEVVTDLELEIDAPFEVDHCGTCTRCLDACPTAAFVEPRVLDATRCISYLTIEHKGPIPAEMASSLNGWAFGCDICNDVCPWNERFAQGTAEPAFQPRADLDAAGPSFFDTMDAAEFERRFGDTPLSRAGLAGMRRNWKAAWESLG